MLQAQSRGCSKSEIARCPQERFPPSCPCSYLDSSTAQLGLPSHVISTTFCSNPGPGLAEPELPCLACLSFLLFCHCSGSLGAEIFFITHSFIHYGHLKSRGWRDSSVVKSEYYNSRGPSWFLACTMCDYNHPVSPAPRDLTSSSDFCGHLNPHAHAHTCVFTHTHTIRINLCIF